MDKLTALTEVMKILDCTYIDAFAFASSLPRVKDWQEVVIAAQEIMEDVSVYITVEL